MKDLQEDNLFESVRGRLGRYEEEPSEDVWNKIAASKKSERRWMLFVEPVAVVVVGVALMISGGRMDEMTTNEMTKEEMTKDGRTTKNGVTIDEMTSGNEDRLILTDSVGNKNKTSLSSVEQVAYREPEISDKRNLEPATLEPKVETKNPDLKISKDSSTHLDPIPPYKKPRSKFQFYLSVTPSLAFNKMIPASNDEIIMQGFEPRSPLSLKRFGVGIDFGFEREINRFFGFYGGASFYHQNQEIAYSYFEKKAVVMRVGDSFIYEITREQHTKTFNYSMNNLGVSGGVLVTLKGEKLKHKFGAGLTYTHSLNSTDSYLAYRLSYRNEVHINDYWSWYIEPTFIYSFIAKEKLNEPFTMKPYRAGITTGLLYRF